MSKAKQILNDRSRAQRSMGQWDGRRVKLRQDGEPDGRSLNSTGRTELLSLRVHPRMRLALVELAARTGRGQGDLIETGIMMMQEKYAGDLSHHWRKWVPQSPARRRPFAE